MFDAICRTSFFVSNLVVDSSSDARPASAIADSSELFRKGLK
jgi:hypothetical protein